MIETLMYMSLFCVGLKISLEEGMILRPIHNWLERKIKKEWIKKLLFSCVYCFSSFWGAAVYWAVPHKGYSGVELIVYWLILTVCCVCVNGVFYSGLKAEYRK